MIQERNGSNTVQRVYTRSVRVGGLLAMERRDSSTAAGHYYYHYDARGNVVQLTNATQTVVADYRYDAWGNSRGITGSGAAENLFRFSTHELHPASGLYDCGFRFYDPGSGRFLNRDPIGEAGGLNLHEYCLNNPLSYVDPDGNFPTWLGPIAGGVGARPLPMAPNLAARTPVHHLPPRGGTYLLRDLAGRVVRTGRTKDLARREVEHKKDPILGRYRFEVDRKTDNYAAQRGREQIIHDLYKPRLNKIRPIRENNPNRERYMEEGGKLGILVPIPQSSDPTSPCETQEPGFWLQFKEWFFEKPTPPTTMFTPRIA